MLRLLEVLEVSLDSSSSQSLRRRHRQTQAPISLDLLQGLEDRVLVLLVVSVVVRGHQHGRFVVGNAAQVLSNLADFVTGDKKEASSKEAHSELYFKFINDDPWTVDKTDAQMELLSAL